MGIKRSGDCSQGQLGIYLDMVKNQPPYPHYFILESGLIDISFINGQLWDKLIKLSKAIKL